MNARTLILASLIGASLWLAIFAAVTHATTPKPKPTHAIGTAVISQTGHKLAPPVICNMANRMMIFVDEDNILWACECEALASGFTCRWQVIGGVDAITTRRRIRMRLHVRVVPRLTLLVLR